MDNNSSKLTDLAYQVKTDDERNDLLQDLDFLKAYIYKKRHEDLKSFVGGTAYKVFKLLLASKKPDQLEKEIDNAFKILTDLELLEITLAIDPSQELIEDIFLWARRRLTENIILKIKVDPNIIAGVVLVFGGQYKDYSVKTILEDKLATYAGK